MPRHMAAAPKPAASTKADAHKRTQGGGAQGGGTQGGGAQVAARRAAAHRRLHAGQRRRQGALLAGAHSGMKAELVAKPMPQVMASSLPCSGTAGRQQGVQWGL